MRALCAKVGLVSVGVIAVDGTLIEGNASPTATRSYAAIRREVEEMLEQAAAADAADDARFGEARGDELPLELADPRSRRERLRRCKEELEHEQQQAEAAHEENLVWRAAWEAEHGRKLTGRKPTPPASDGLQRRTINTTDPDTRMLKRAGGRSVQGYNAQIVATPEQVIVAADIFQQSNDSGQPAPMVHDASRMLRTAGVEQPIGTVLADGGYWNTSHIEAITASGVDVIIPTKNNRRVAPAGWPPNKGQRRNESSRCYRVPKAKRSNGDDSRSWSPSSRTRSSTAGSTASNDAGWLAAAPSGG